MATDGEPVAGLTPRQERIDELYAAGANLDQDSDAFAELRRLQEEEADGIEKRFTESLALPLDAGAKLLAETRELLEKHGGKSQ